MSDMIYRARSVTEILDASFNLFRQHFRAFVTLTAVAYLPLAVFSLLYARYSGVAAGTAATPDFAISTLVVTLIQLIWYTVISALVMTMASRAYLDEPLEPGTTWKSALSRLPSVIGATMVLGFASGIGMLLLIFPGLYLYTRFAAAPTVAVLEGLGVNASLSRASVLSEGRKLHIFGVTALAILLYIIVLIGLGVIALLLPSTLLKNVFSLIGTALALPILPIIQTTLYYDLRIRGEGYDVELMSRKLDQPVNAPAEAIS